MSHPSHSIDPATPLAEAPDLELEFARARELHNAGSLDEAEQAYGRILAAVPDHAEALHFQGLAVHQRGDHARAIELIRAAIALNGEQFGWYSNLGNVLLLSGQKDAAAEAYEQAMRLAPERADIHNNLGVLQGDQGRLEEAESTLRRAVALDPDKAEVHANLGRVLLRLARNDEALGCLDEALRLNPDLMMARPMLGLVYRRLGRLDAAAQVYRDWLARDPGDPTALHHLAGCSGEAVPERAADAYLERTFDAFANTFDDTLAAAALPRAGAGRRGRGAAPGRAAARAGRARCRLRHRPVRAADRTVRAAPGRCRPVAADARQGAAAAGLRHADEGRAHRLTSRPPSRPPATSSSRPTR